MLLTVSDSENALTCGQKRENSPSSASVTNITISTGAASASPCATRSVNSAPMRGRSTENSAPAGTVA
ncbi:hypothetical protein NCM_01069 [Burkholderia pseudomallei]